MNLAITQTAAPPIAPNEVGLFTKELTNIREEFRNNPYILETEKVLRVGGYRSAIGSFWNAVIDDLRRKITHRSLDLFNKEMGTSVKTYEDFQDHVTDFQLINGAFKIGVLSWEDKKMLHQARETRNIFSGHPKSSDPNIFKVMNMVADCNRCVLSQDYPPAVVDIDAYLATMDSTTFSRNEVAIKQAFCDLPDVYRLELLNKFFNSYIHDSSSTELRANIELCFPILWASYLTKDNRKQIGSRVDREIVAGNQVRIEKAIGFMTLNSDGLRYVSSATRESVFTEAIEKHEGCIDKWAEEATAVSYLERLGTSVPDGLINRYVAALTATYVGKDGYSHYHSRTNFYSNAAAPVVIRLFERFDDRAASAFVEAIKTDSSLYWRFRGDAKMNRLRTLAQTLLERPHLRDDIKDYLELIVDPERINEFRKSLKTRK
jgi:hypothetical protein